MRVRHAFTLAETLITLGIIGVVAAMTIPNLIQNNRDKRVYTQLKTIQSILSQVIRAAEDEFGGVSGWGITGADEQSANIIANNIKPFMKLADDCGTKNVNKVCKTATYKLRNGSLWASYTNNSAHYKVKLLNGTFIWWRGNASRYYIDFFVDVNGLAGPNQWGTDLFEMLYFEDIGLRPNGAPGLDDYERTCIPKTGTGFGCAWYVLTFGDMNYLKNK
ncbi:MAG: type II secretion system GspH family protein [Muribaculaceae bacterium]|nr:type II secretion system GspH family protein [Muribaculaceae bacterium]